MSKLLKLNQLDGTNIIKTIANEESIDDADQVVKDEQKTAVSAFDSTSWFNFVLTPWKLILIWEYVTNTLAITST